MQGLDALRSSIDRVDQALADLLARRALLTRRVALLKRLDGIPPRDVRREAEVRDHYARILRPIGWSPHGIDALLDALIAASHDLQARPAVAYQGGRGSWSDESLEAHLPGIERMACDSVEDAWHAVTRGAAVAAWVAVENSTLGLLPETADVRARGDPWLEVAYPVQHALLAAPGTTLDTVRVVAGHPRALDQCRATLDSILPHADRRGVVDGAWASHPERRAFGVAIVGSARLADAGLQVLRADVCDQPDNRTTFQLVVPRRAL